MDKMRYCIANWKMNITVSAAMKFIDAWQNKDLSNKSVKTIICPPFTALYPIASFIEKISFELGAQNVYHEDVGAFTGEISCEMLKELGCKWVIIGHSERRTTFGETNEMIRRKLHHVVSRGMSAILCIGETMDERNNGQTTIVLEKQLKKAFANLESDNISSIVIAYEPVWTIGTGSIASSDVVAKAHAEIHEIMQEYGEHIAVIYGGSVTEENVSSLSKINNVNGFLVGGASLDIEKFYDIYNQL